MDLKNKLHHLLYHWMEHNEGHAAEYEKWVNEAKAAGLDAAAKRIAAAAQVVLRANDKLKEACNELGD